MAELVAGTVAPTVADRPPGPPPRPKLRRPERRDDPARWREVIPPTLAEQVADSEPAKQHRALTSASRRPPSSCASSSA
jgi:hypothetical protein